MSRPYQIASPALKNIRNGRAGFGPTVSSSTASTPQQTPARSFFTTHTKDNA